MASILQDIGTALGEELKTLDLRLSSAESAIIDLGGQEPPPTGNLVITDVQWKNISEIISSPAYVPEPENDGSYRGSASVPVILIALMEISLGGAIMPVGKIINGVGTGTYGGDSKIRMEDPDDPRDRPYTTTNQNTGTWAWHDWANRGITWEYAKLNIVLPSGEAEVTGNSTITKIGGALDFDTGGSSTNFIGGDTNGYFQFQVNGKLRIGVVYEDTNYEVNAPYSWNFVGNQYSHPTTSVSKPYTDGEWFRIRHYASDNQIHIQRKQDVFGENNELIGQGYVTEFVHPTLTNGEHLYLDVSLREVGSSVNDPKIARTE